MAKTSMSKPRAMKCSGDRPVRRRVEFSIRADAGKTVMVAGSFNDWSPGKEFSYDAETGLYQLSMMLQPGTYEYKFVVDGDWKCDDANPNFASNDFGTLNSVLVVEPK